MSQFKIIAGDKKEYGPVSVEEVGRWIQQGRANGDTRVQAEGETDWTPLREVPELAVLLGGPTPQPAGGPPVLGPGLASAPLTADQLMAELQGRPHTFAVGECFRAGWRLYKANFRLFLLSTVCFFLLSFVAGIIPFGTMIVAGPLTGGVYLIFLQRLRGEPAAVGDLFAGFRLAFLPLFLVYLLVAVIIIASFLPVGLILGVGFVAGMATLGAEETIPIMVLVGLVLYLIPLALWGMLAFAFPVAIDHRTEVMDTLKATWRVTRQCWGKCLGLMVLLMACSMLPYLPVIVCVVFATLAGWSEIWVVAVVILTLLGILMSLMLMPLFFAAPAVAYEKLFGRGGKPA